MKRVVELHQELAIWASFESDTSCLGSPYPALQLIVPDTIEISQVTRLQFFIEKTPSGAIIVVQVICEKQIIEILLKPSDQAVYNLSKQQHLVVIQQRKSSEDDGLIHVRQDKIRIPILAGRNIWIARGAASSHDEKCNRLSWPDAVRFYKEQAD